MFDDLVQRRPWQPVRRQRSQASLDQRVMPGELPGIFEAALGQQRRIGPAPVRHPPFETVDQGEHGLVVRGKSSVHIGGPGCLIWIIARSGRCRAPISTSLHGAPARLQPPP